MNYPEEVLAEDDEEESDEGFKNRQFNQDDGSNQNFAYYRDDEGRIVNTEEAMRQQKMYLQQDQFIKRFHPEQQIDSEMMRSHEPHSRIASVPVQNLHGTASLLN